MKSVFRTGVALLVTSSCLVFVHVAPVEALSATTTTVAMSPNPAIVGQAVTLTATPSVPGVVTFTVDGQTVGTGTAVGSGASGANQQAWSYTGNSVAMATDNDASGNLFVSSQNPSDCGGARCVSKMLMTNGTVNHFVNQSWNGVNVVVTGLTVASDGVIYEAVGASNKIYKRTSYNANTTEFASGGQLNNPCHMTTDENDNVYVANRGSGTVLKITPAGAVSTYATGLTSPCGIEINRTTGVLFVSDGNGDIQSIPSGGGSPTRFLDGSCAVQGQLAIDAVGNLYGWHCTNDLAVHPNGYGIIQISPTGTWRKYSQQNIHPGSCSNCNSGFGVGQNSERSLSLFNGLLFIAGAGMSASGVYRFGVSGYIATLTHTPTASGTLAVGSSLTPTDSGSFAASSGTGSLSVSPAAPSAPDLATSSDLGNSSTDNITNDNTPLIELAGSGTSGNTITVTASRSGATNVTCSYVLPATGCSLGTLSDGAWSITATESHPTSGASTASAALSVSIDASAPAAPGVPDLATSSDTGTSSTDNNTNDNTPTLSATGGSSGDTVTLSATNGTSTVTCSYVLGSATSCTLPTMSDGTWTITSSVTDPAGNTTNNPTSLSVGIDTSAVGGLAVDLAASSDTGSSSTDNNTSDATPTFSLTGQSTGDVVVITASRAGATDVTCTYTVGVASSCTLGSLTDGSWSVIANVTDASGNTGNTSALSMTIATSASAPGIPDLVNSSDTGASATDNLTSDTTPAISGGALPAGTSVTVSARKADGTTVSCTYVASASVSSCDLPSLSDGEWSVSTVITDPAGNVSPASSALSLTIDASAPSAGVPDLLDASDTGTSATDNLTSDTTPAISGGALPAGTSVTVSARKANGTTVSCTYVASASVSSCDLPSLSDGEWSVSTVMTDLAGNVSPASSALSLSVNKSLLDAAVDAQSDGPSGVLPQDIARLDQTSLNFGSGWITATANLKKNEVGRVSHVVFMVRNADGTTARTVRMKVPAAARRISTRLPRLDDGQRIVTFVENNYGLSPSAPKRRNVVQGPTGRGRDAAGNPVLFGTSLLVDRIIFDATSPLLDVRDRAQLDRLARELRGRAGLLLISGFARQNLIDGSKFLKNLSIERARNVANYLSTKGVRAWIRFDGYGAITNEPGTANDRRVDIRWSNAGREAFIQK
jgi:outer membrane protein OmpA-like peptidoglycan-associated protein